MGIHKVAQRNLSVAFRPGSYFFYRFESGSYWRLHFCNVPATERSGRYRAGCFRLLSRMRNRFQHRLAIDVIGSRQVIVALPDTPRAASIGLPVDLRARHSGNKPGRGFFRALELLKNRVTIFGNGRHWLTAQLKTRLGRRITWRWLFRSQFPAPPREDR